MSRRASSRLAAQQISSQISDKENHPSPISNPLKIPATTKEKANTKERAVPPKQNRLTQNVTDAKSTPKSSSEIDKSSNKIENSNAVLPTQSARKRKRGMSDPKIEEDEDDDDELPHNMGKRVASKARTTDAQPQPSKKKAESSPKTAKQEETFTDGKEIIEDAQKPLKKKARKAHPYGLTPGETPFPDWPHPTKEECHIVHDLLMNTIPPERRKKFVPPDDIPPPSEVVAGCGEVPSILDALIRTLLSAATNGQNSSNAFQGLVKRFGLATDGLGKGSVNWNAVHEASHEDVFDAIKCGGLAKNKSANIKKLLAMVHQENKERLHNLLAAKEAGKVDNETDKEEKAEKELELRALQQGTLTLDYYHHLEKNAAISTFTAYPGIGVKTAACVSLFCMQRPCFAVDTHVFRLCQYLGWVPPPTPENSRQQKKVDRNTTFSHCEVMVPDELKYGLHQLFLEHGKKCPRCRAVTGEKSEGWAEAKCVIEHLVKRLGAKKGGVDEGKAKKKKGGKTKKEEEEEDDDDEVSGEEDEAGGSDVQVDDGESMEQSPPVIKKTRIRGRYAASAVEE